MNRVHILTLTCQHEAPLTLLYLNMEMIHYLIDNLNKFSEQKSGHRIKPGSKNFCHFVDILESKAFTERNFSLFITP